MNVTSFKNTKKQGVRKLRIKKNKILIVFGLLILFTSLFACSSNNNEKTNEETKKTVNKSGFPIVEDEITIEMFTGKSIASANVDWNDLIVWNEYEDLTNINIDWTKQASGKELEEMRNLALGSGDVPHAFFASSLSNADILKYAKQGTLIKLNDLIDEYAPNLKKLMEEDPNILKSMTFPDGNIYTMPSIREQDDLALRMWAMPWFSEDWLEKLDMDIPKTTEEHYEFLKAVKESDSEAIPLGGMNINTLYVWLRGSFIEGVTTTDYLIAEGNDLRFLQTSDEYRELLKHMHKLFDEELIQQNIFSQEVDQFLANAAEGKYANTVHWDPEFTFNRSEYVGGIPLKGPGGVQVYEEVFPTLNANGQFVITDENPYPEATVRWMDYFYSDDGAQLMYMGIENETFIEEDGEFRYVDEIYESDQREEKMAEYVPWHGITPPGIRKGKYYDGSETTDASVEAADQIEPYIPDDDVIKSSFIYTENENNIMNSTGADIQKYVIEMRDKFITGDESLDDDNWNDYVETVERMGLEEYMKVQRDTFDRYESE